ncbi:MAG: hypothetical protein M1319_01000 [Chloroflexi bacterium]|nr:hypothetical protein [Chloroflexota bacterium]
MGNAIRLCLNTSPEPFLSWMREQEADPSLDLAIQRIETKKALDAKGQSPCAPPAREIESGGPNLEASAPVPDAVVLMQLAAGLPGRRSLAELRRAASIVDKVMWVDVTPLPGGRVEVLIDFYDLQPPEMAATFSAMLQQVYGQYPETDNISDFVLVKTHGMLQSIAECYPEAADTIASFLA